jgi:uncharacterized metal-binding protein YceD (DUF177 family)
MTSAPRPEFSRRVQVHRGVEPLQSFAIEASDTERKALAKRFDLISLDSFKADGTVRTLNDGRRAVLEGHILARVVQPCVVTLEPVASEIDESFTVEYAADAGAPAVEQEIELDPDMPDPPDPLEGEAVDVGEASAEHLALALDPYPRAPGAELPGQPGGGEAEKAAESGGSAARNSPFVALARLVRKGNK